MSRRSARILSLVIATFIVLAGIVTAFPIAIVSAAGLATTVTPSALSAATATDVTFSYTPSAGYAAADTVPITAASGVTITNTCAKHQQLHIEQQWTVILQQVSILRQLLIQLQQASKLVI